MRYGADQKERTRQRVLAEASRAIRADGPHRVGVAEVMKRAGLTHGGFYAHFGSKEELVGEALDFMFDEAAAVSGGWAAGETPQAALASYIRVYLSRAHRDDRASGCPLPALGAELPRMNEDARERFAQGLSRMTARLGVLLDGADRPGGEATSVLNEMVGALVLSRATPDPVQSDRILAETRRSLLRRLDLEERS